MPLGQPRLNAIPCFLFALFAAWFFTGLSARASEPVRLQLKWHHQFQFAGYYAALLQGYYAEEGLEVDIQEGGADRAPIARVLSGQAHFGVSDTDVLLERLQGRPLVACAAIFQHSPYVILSRMERHIRSPRDLIGARVMLAEGQGASQFRAMLAREDIDAGAIQIVPHSWNLDDLVAGKVDAVSAYATVEPYLLSRRGVTPSLLRTLDYGVNFYGDTLFTTETFLAEHPERARAFVRASLRGWDYAMRYPEKIVEYILTLPSTASRGTARDQLLAEAEAMRAYVLPDVVELGHMNRARWQIIADTFITQDLAPDGASLDGFMIEPERADLRRIILIATALVGALGGIIALVAFWNVQMRSRVQERTRALREEVSRREAAEAELRSGRERLKLAQVVGAIGDWTYDAMSGRASWSDTLFVLHARAAERGAPTLEEWTALYDPEDAARLRDCIERALRHRQEFALDLRLRLPDGRQHFHHMVGKVDTEPSGRVTRLHGIEQDITERKFAEERLRDQLRELERWREVTLGREERIHALKREVNALRLQASLPALYDLEARPAPDSPRTKPPIMPT
ncbi:MAG: ABC transporter substrate-binding protein [Opitutaceae bacterium]|jgi:ABC-type nitrate/sulfonate/bicarbonate transport system substrate-binding protein|nr:ABC transporter substrate-binding protein [Opitutaceae bacterium]